MTKTRHEGTATNDTTSRDAAKAARKARAAAIRSLMLDSGYNRREATALVDSGFGGQS